MKIKLLFAFIAFSLLSCSSDDNNEPVNTNPDDNNPPVEKHIKEITFYTPINLEGDMEYFGLKRYENGVPTEEYYGFEGNDYENAITKILYTYDAENRLTEMILDHSDDITNITFEYDALGRLTSKHIDAQYNGGLSGDVVHTDFTYDVDNQIFASTTSTYFGTHDSYTTYYEGIKYLNNEGYVYKISGVSENSNFTEATYENGNIVSVSRFEYDESAGEYTTTLTRSYTYDMEHEVKGEYNFTNVTSNALIALDKNVFGSNNANTALHNFGVSDEMSNYPTQFLNYESSTPSPIRSRTYEFDEDGYPIKSQWISANGEIYQEEYITYYE